MLKNIKYTKNFTGGILEGGVIYETMQGVSEISMKRLRELENSGEILTPPFSSPYYLTDVEVVA